MAELSLSKTLRADLEEKGIRFQDLMPIGDGLDYSLCALEVSTDLQTEEVVKSSIRDVPPSFWRNEKPVLSYCREDLLDRSLCLDAVRSDARNLKHVPLRLLDKEMCIAALEKNGNLLGDIPDALVSREICEVAVKSRPMSLRFVPNELIDGELCERALSVVGVGLQFVPEEMRTRRLCLLALAKLSSSLAEGRDGYFRRIRENAFKESFRAVPSGLLDHEICELAVETMPSLLNEVPDKVLDESLCIAAIGSPQFDRCSTRFFEMLPKELLSDNVINLALDASGMSLASLDTRRRTKARCERAVHSCPQALRHVPPRIMTEALCESAVARDWQALSWVPKEMITTAMCDAAIAQSWRAARYVPKGLLSTEKAVEVLEGALLKHALKPGYSRRPPVRSVLEIRSRFRPSTQRDARVRFLERRLGVRNLVSCSYDSAKERFVVREEVMVESDGPDSRWRKTVVRKRDLKSLSEYLMSDLSDVCLDGYEMSDEEASTFRSTDLERSAMWQVATKDLAKAEFSEPSPSLIIPGPQPDSVLSRGDVVIFYVTDIHLRHRIAVRFPNGASDHDVRAYLRTLARSLAQMRDEVARRDDTSILFVGGDTSDSFTLSSLFYAELSKVWEPSGVYVTLGNHELWEAPEGVEGMAGVEHVVERYRQMLSGLGITLLHNELAMLGPDRKVSRFDAEALMDATRGDELQDSADGAYLLAFGGIGFSKFSPDFNYTSGIYRQVIRTANQEAEQSGLADNLHRRLVELFGRRLVVFVTHMPMRCWSKGMFHERWAYVSGHTHQNGLDVWEKGGHYYDTQVGYESEEMMLGHFSVPGKRDVFWRHGDGIYRISHRQYREFNAGVGIHCEFTRQGEVLMLKRSGYYLFMLRHNGRLYRLEGGTIRSIGKWDIVSMYDALAVYAKASRAVFSGYHEALVRIGDEIRELGGWGRVHGSIVDVDWNSHIYVDPLGEGISYYYATSISPLDRMEYKDLRSLLKARSPELLPSYERRASELGVVVDAAAEGLSLVKEFDSAVVRTTYTRSRIARSFQYLFDTNVVRNWDDGLLRALADIAASTGKMDAAASGPRLGPVPDN